MSSTIEQLVNREYQYGFSTDIETETLPPGLTEETVRFISAKKQEPEWLLDWRLKAFRRWQTMKEPHWANVQYPPIDYQAISYYSTPRAKAGSTCSLTPLCPAHSSSSLACGGTLLTFLPDRTAPLPVPAEPRAVLAEFGLELPDAVEVVVHDSTAELRYLVLPERPDGTAGMDEASLAALVTRDCMIGTAIPVAPKDKRKAA